MSFLEIFLIALSLASDAFAVSISAGSTGAAQGPRSMLRLSFHFGFFQFLMPILGWLAGLSIERYVQSFDHWVAFALLTWVAVRMIQSARAGDKQVVQQDPSRGNDAGCSLGCDKSGCVSDWIEFGVTASFHLVPCCCHWYCHRCNIVHWYFSWSAVF